MTWEMYWDFAVKHLIVNGLVSAVLIVIAGIIYSFYIYLNSKGK